jgi:hypothetical protein
MTLLSSIGASRLQRWDPAPLDPARRNAPAGLGGWLILPALSLPLRLFFCLQALYLGRVFLDTGTWHEFTSPDGSHYQPMFVFAALAETGANIMLAAHMVLLMVLLLKRRTSLPWLLPASLWLQTLVLVGDAYLAGQSGMESADTMHDASRALIASIVWSMYFAASARVRGTFVNRRGALAHERDRIGPTLVPADG